jgi:hypothetical protein
VIARKIILKMILAGLLNAYFAIIPIRKYSIVTKMVKTKITKNPTFFKNTKVAKIQVMRIIGREMPK